MRHKSDSHHLGLMTRQLLRDESDGDTSSSDFAPNYLSDDVSRLAKDAKQILNLFQRADEIESDIKSTSIGLRPPSDDDVPDASEFLPEVDGYEILSLLSRGGQANVYKAKNLKLRKIVALKIFNLDPYRSGITTLRLEREVDSLAKLDHPNIVRVIDRSMTRNGHPVVVTEFIDGQTLSDHIKSLGPTTDAASIQERLNIFYAVCSAVQAVHAQGLLHRDIKPTNVMIGADGQVRLIDFGLVRPAESSEAHPTVTRSNGFVGTLTWCSPEQAYGQKTDVRTDVYGLGQLLYFLMAGRPPFESDLTDIGEYVSRIKSRAYESPFASRKEKTMQRSIMHVIDTCLASNAAERYQSTDQLLSDVNKLRDGERLYPRSWKGLAVAVAMLLMSAAAFGSYTINRFDSPNFGEMQPPTYVIDNWEAQTNSDLNVAVPWKDIPGTIWFCKGHTYATLPGRWDWTEANAHAEQLGGHLLVLESKAEISFFSIIRQVGMRPTVSQLCWMGIETDGNTHKTVTGQQLEELFFKNNQKPFEGVYGTAIDSLSWIPLPKTAKTGIAIEWPFLPDPSQMEWGTPPANARIFGEYAYAIIEDKANWLEARDNSRAMGGLFATIESEEHEVFIKSLPEYRALENKQVWLGLGFFNHEQLRLDGQPVTYSKFPQLNGPRAGVVRTNGSEWETILPREFHRFPYICKWYVGPNSEK